MKPKITPALKSAVNAYLMARANAELQREAVDRIEREVLESASYYTETKKRISDPAKTYQLCDSESRDYLLTLKQALINNGYDIKSIKGEPETHYYCPALVAENLQRMTEKVLVEAAAEMFGFGKEFEQRLRYKPDKCEKFIDLAVRLVVNSPDFKPPTI